MEQSWTPCPACQGSQGVRGFVSLAMVSWHGVKMNQAPRNLERSWVRFGSRFNCQLVLFLNKFYHHPGVFIITLKRSHSTFSIIYMFTGQMEIIFHQARILWNKGSHFPSYSLPFGGKKVVWGRDLIWPDCITSFWRLVCFVSFPRSSC